MKDNNGIDILCKNCVFYAGRFCDVRETFSECNKKDYFHPTEEAYKARIAELQEKLTETMELLEENSKECGYGGEKNPFVENIVAWIEENQNEDLPKFLSNLDICCYSTKYNEDIICIQPNGPHGANFEIAQLFSNLDRTLAQYNRTKPFAKVLLQRIELLFKIHKGQTNEQLKNILKKENEEMSAQSTNVCDVSKNSKNSTESEEK